MSEAIETPDAPVADTTLAEPSKFNLDDAFAPEPEYVEHVEPVADDKSPAPEKAAVEPKSDTEGDTEDEVVTLPKKDLDAFMKAWENGDLPEVPVAEAEKAIEPAPVQAEKPAPAPETDVNPFEAFTSEPSAFVGTPEQIEASKERILSDPDYLVQCIDSVVLRHLANFEKHGQRVTRAMVGEFYGEHSESDKMIAVLLKDMPEVTEASAVKYLAKAKARLPKNATKEDVFAKAKELIEPGLKIYRNIMNQGKKVDVSVKRGKLPTSRGTGPGRDPSGKFTSEDNEENGADFLNEVSNDAYQKAREGMLGPRKSS